MNNNQELELDNSRRSAFTKCPYRYYLPYVKGVVPVHGSTALRYGTTFHAGMEGLYSHIKENGWTRDGMALERAVNYAKAAWDRESALYSFKDDYRTFDNFVKSLVLYLDHFSADEKFLEVVSTERSFRIRISENLWFTGKLDMEMILNGSDWINEFKTTGQGITYVANQQNRDNQFIGYTFAMKKLHQKQPEGILITYHQLTAYKSKKTGEYGETTINFDRIPQFFGDNDLNEWVESFIYTASLIQTCYKMNIWPKQYDSCYLYGSCPYLFLCEQHRPRDQEILGDQFLIREPWNVLHTVAEDKVITAK